MTTERRTAPDLLTVKQTRQVLNIGRTKAYELARLWFATGGRDGLQAVRVGHQIRFVTRGLEELTGGPITWPIPDEPAAEAPEASITVIETRPGSRRRRRSSPSQPSLPLSS